MDITKKLNQSKQDFAKKWLKKGIFKNYYLTLNHSGLLHESFKMRVEQDALRYDRLSIGTSRISQYFDDTYDFFLNELNALVKSRKNISQEDFDKWHNNLCRNKMYDMRFGVWQKVINLTFKYISTCEDTFPEYKCVLKYAHCPIDNKICKKILSDLNSIDTTNDKEYNPKYKDIAYNIQKKKDGMYWNYISESDYNALQDAVTYIIHKKDLKQTSGEYLSKLEYSFL